MKAVGQGTKTGTTNELNLAWVQAFANDVFGAHAHRARLESIANATAGAMKASVAAIHAIGAAYATLVAGNSKHGIKQVDRLLSNDAFDLVSLFVPWVQFIVASRKEVLLALDWTDFADDEQTTLCLYLLTQHGRATPLMWNTVSKTTLRDSRNQYEYELIERLHSILDPDIAITLLADRGFGDQKLYAFLEALGVDFVIRFRKNVTVEDKNGVSKPAQEWLGDGRARIVREAKVTQDRTAIGAMVTIQTKEMKEGWFLATSLGNETAATIVKLYGRRFTIEESFRDQKDLHFGMGLKSTHIKRADRRDRLLFIIAVAISLLTLLGAASERCGLAKTLKSNTSPKRTHSLFRQGTYWFDSIPYMKQERLELILSTFKFVLEEHAQCLLLLGIL